MRLLTAFVLKKLFAAGGLEDRSASLNDIGYAPGMHGHDIVLDHSTISPHDTKYLQSIIYTGTNNGTDGGIHSRSIAAGSEDTNFSDFVFHLEYCSLLLIF